MKKLLFLAAVIISAQQISAQECDMFIPLRPGAELSYAYYNKPGVVESTAKTTILEKSSIPGGVNVKLNTEAFDKDGKSVVKFDYNMKCQNGVFYVDMRSMLANMDVKDISNFSVESKDLQFPSRMSAGQILSDASLLMKMSAGFMTMSITVDIINRKVESVETITTPAGTFECYKITYDSNSKVLMIKTQNHIVEWYAKNVGLVRSESYDKKGKLTNITELTSLK